MVGSAAEAHWQGVYEKNAPDRVSWYQAEPRLSLALIARAGIRPDARVVDVGGGASVLVDRLIDRGFADITVLDIAESALARSRARLGPRAERVRWVVADVTGWRPEGSFDLWHDRAVFHFLTEAADRARYVEALRAALAPGGHAIVATFALDGPERCSGLPVVRYGPESLLAELGPGFTLVASEREEHVTPAGRVQPFTYALFRRD